MTNEGVSDLLDKEQLIKPQMRSMYDLWSKKTQQKGDLPAWKDFDLHEIVETMPHLSLVEYVENEDRFRVRFSGSEYDDLIGRDITGTFFDELPDSENLEARARRVKDSQTPIVMEGLPLRWAEQEERRFVAFSLPLKKTPDGPVNQLLYMMVLQH